MDMKYILFYSILFYSIQDQGGNNMQMEGRIWKENEKEEFWEDRDGEVWLEDDTHKSGNGGGGDAE
jgi:hypothetical protein